MKNNSSKPYLEGLKLFLGSQCYKKWTRVIVVFYLIITVVVNVGLLPSQWKWVKLAINSERRTKEAGYDFDKEMRMPPEYSFSETMAFIKWLTHKSGDVFEKKLRKVTLHNLALIFIIPILFPFLLHLLFTLNVPLFPKGLTLFMKESNWPWGVYFFGLIAFNAVGSTILVKIMMMEAF